MNDTCMQRFHLANLQHLQLIGDQAHHALHVMRVKPGDTLAVFDGRGHEVHCRVLSIENDSVNLESLSATTTLPLKVAITLAQAVPKRSMDLIVQKAAELGVTVVIPLISERTIVQLDADAPKVDRWRQIALESCKQCGNNWLPEIHAPLRAREFLDRLSAQPSAYTLKLIASLQPGALPLKQILNEYGPANAIQSVLIMIGPEGDFTPAELALARSAGCVPLSLGPLILRAETAAIYTLSILHHELQVT